MRNRFLVLFSYFKTWRKLLYDVGDCPFWISVDETVDSAGRCIANVLMGTLRTESPKLFLVSVKELSKVNSETISQLIMDTLREYLVLSFSLLFPNEFVQNIQIHLNWFTSNIEQLCPDGSQRQRFKVLATDGAAYMLKAGRNLKPFFPDLIHVTCVAHGFHLVAESIRQTFPLIDQLIANCKKVFLKAPYRVSAFKQQNPGMILPPEPIVTRWGTWIKAANYHAENYNAMRNFIETLDPADSQAIRKIQDLYKLKILEQQIGFLKANCSFIPGLIEKMEAKNMELTKAISIVHEFELKVHKIPDKLGQPIKKKWNFVRQKNEGLKT